MAHPLQMLANMTLLNKVDEKSRADHFIDENNKCRYDRKYYLTIWTGELHVVNQHHHKYHGTRIYIAIEPFIKVYIYLYIINNKKKNTTTACVS